MARQWSWQYPSGRQRTSIQWIGDSECPWADPQGQAAAPITAPTGRRSLHGNRGSGERIRCASSLPIRPGPRARFMLLPAAACQRLQPDNNYPAGQVEGTAAAMASNVAVTLPPGSTKRSGARPQPPRTGQPPPAFATLTINTVGVADGSGCRRRRSAQSNTVTVTAGPPR